MDLIMKSQYGMYCTKGDFYIDPHKPVKRAVITHAHSDHAYPGSLQYYSSEQTKPLLVTRKIPEILINSFKYRENFKINDVNLSFYPAGHILGSSQVRIEYEGEVWVISGDYKREKDPTCEPFEVVECDVFITESTFALPIYVWPEINETINSIYKWWKDCERIGKIPILFGYSLGKSQRIIAELRNLTDKEIFAYSTICNLNKNYEKSGIPLKNVIDASKEKNIKSLILAPPHLSRSEWLDKFKNISTAFASGWMITSNNRKQKGYDKGYIVSDHCDWPALIKTCEETKAKKIVIHHGYKDMLEKYLIENGFIVENLKI